MYCKPISPMQSFSNSDNYGYRQNYERKIWMSKENHIHDLLYNLLNHILPF